MCARSVQSSGQLAFRLSFSSRYVPFFSQIMQQKMKVNDASIIAPLNEPAADCVVTRRLAEPEISLQFILCTHIIAWKHLQPSESSQRHVLRRPPTDSS